MYGIFTNRGDGYTYGYVQLEFATLDYTSVAVQAKLKEKLNLTDDEIIELTSSDFHSVDLEPDRYDKHHNSFNSVYIENLDIV